MGSPRRPGWSISMRICSDDNLLYASWLSCCRGHRIRCLTSRSKHSFFPVISSAPVSTKYRDRICLDFLRHELLSSSGLVSRAKLFYVMCTSASQTLAQRSFHMKYITIGEEKQSFVSSMKCTLGWRTVSVGRRRNILQQDIPPL